MIKLFGGKPDHPMADAKEAKRILESLPAGDAAKALEELEHWLDSLATAEGFKPEQRIGLLFTVDEAAQTRLRKLVREYLAAVRPSRYQENRLWHRIHEYYKHAADAYARVLAGLSQDPKGASSIKAQLPLLLARTLRCAAQRIKWIQFRYGPTDLAVWGLLNLVYAHAERSGQTESAVTVYPGEGAESSPRREFLKAAMFGASSPDGLLPAEVELAERLISEHAGGFAIATAPAAELAYWSDLGQAMAPLRVTRAPQPTPGLRCFGASRALAQLQAQIARIEGTRQLPNEPAFAGVQDVETALDVMRHLAMYWSPVAPERKSQRHNVKSRLTVTYGLNGVLSALGGAADSLDFEEIANENWIVENVSAGGFGAVVPQVKGDWLKVGVLIAMQPEGGDNWVVGIVRRVSKIGGQQARVGIQTLSRTPLAYRFTLEGGAAEPGVLLRPPEPDATEARIALRTGAFVQGQKLELELAGRLHMFLSQGIAERGEDFEIGRFREMIRE